MSNHSVAHLSWEYPPHLAGGLGVACAGLVGALQQRCSVEVFHAGLLDTTGDDGAYMAAVVEPCEPEEVLARVLSGRILASDPYFTKVQRFCAYVVAKFAEQTRVVHAHDWHSILPAVALKRLYGTPFVLHLHSTQTEREGEQARGFIHALEQWGMEYADAVVAVSRCSLLHISQNYVLDMRKAHVVHNACDCVFVEKVISRAPQTLLFAGRMCSQKSPEFMLEVFRRLHAKHVDLRLLMVGEGELLESLRQSVQFCGLSAVVEVLAGVPFDKMHLVYERADLLCLPSAAEPFGLVALEAAQQGLAVVLSDRCGAAEVLQSAEVLAHHSVTTWVQQISQLVESPTQLAQLVSSLQKEAASRTWQDAADEIIAIYSGVLD